MNGCLAAHIKNHSLGPAMVKTIFSKESGFLRIRVLSQNQEKHVSFYCRNMFGINN